MTEQEAKNVFVKLRKIVGNQNISNCVTFGESVFADILSFVDNSMGLTTFTQTSTAIGCLDKNLDPEEISVNTPEKMLKYKTYEDLLNS